MHLTPTLTTVILIFSTNQSCEFDPPNTQYVPIKTFHSNKLIVKIVLCRIIVVIIMNLIKKITLNLLCSIPCYKVPQIFFWLSKGTHWAIKNLNLKITWKCFALFPAARFNRFFLAFQRNKFSYQNLQLEISWFWRWYFAESL